MKFYTAAFAGIVALTQCFKVVICHSYGNAMSAMGPSFIDNESVSHIAGERAGVVFAELSSLHENVIDAVAGSMVSFLESQGLDYQDPAHIAAVVSFLENVTKDHPEPSKAKKFMEGLKEMAKKAWGKTKDFMKGTGKELLTKCISEVIKASIKQSLPHMEKINEKAMRSLPLNLRVALSPVVYNMWLRFFKGAHIPVPAGYKIENFVCSGLDKEKCDEIIGKVTKNFDASNGYSTDDVAKGKKRPAVKSSKAAKSTAEEEEDGEYDFDF
ncbi:signal peptide-containing protein [Babesia caballi]|uniref:Signal peptide-containing protein n=1 Tax=Babesia caballi TaxID=5871 RepID=A0AAV4LVG7_BABCB|nr:signal peptide-containing protein [Babesia caballi]